MMPSDALGLATRECEAQPEVHPLWKTRAAAWLLVLGAFGVVLTGVEAPRFDLDRYLVPKALVLHGTALGVLLLGFPSLRAARWGFVEWLLAAFVAAGAVSAALATNRWLSLAGWGIGVSSLVLLLAAREVAPVYRWPVLAGLVGAAVTGAALGIAQAYGAEWGWLAETRPPGGTFGNRNFLAHVSVLAAPPLAVMVARLRRPRWLLPALVGLGVLTAAVVLTRSRAAWLGGLGGGVTAAIALLISRHGARPTRRRTATLASALVFAVAAAIFLPNTLQWTSDSPYAETLTRLAEYGEGSGRGRLIQYRNSLELAKEAPIWGVGPGNWFVHYPRVTTDGDPAYAGHLSIPTNPWPSSDWVAVLTERGVLGALLLLIAGTTAAGRALAYARNGTREEALAAAALVALLVTAFVTGSFDAVLLLAAPSYLVWAAAGLLLPEPRRPTTWTPPRYSSRKVRAACALIVLALAVSAGAHTAAMMMTGTGRNRTTLERAARVAPGEHRLQLLLAERGDCPAAMQAQDLMPHHPNVKAMAERCSR
jgi:O-antigen ligase